MKYTFDICWIQAFESCWCTTEKFKFANHINGEQYSDLIGISEKEDLENDLDFSLAANMMYLEALEEITGSNFENCHMQWIKLVLGPLYHKNTFSRYFAISLRYCPKCLSLGYHSIYTQLLWVTRCPFHNMLLQERISKNLSCTAMALSQRKGHLGFEIKIGNPTIEIPLNQLFRHWKTSYDTYSINTSLLGYMEIHYGLYYLPFSLYTYKDGASLFIEKSDIFKKILSLELDYFINKGACISLNNLIVHDPNTTISNDILEEMYCSTYKSLLEKFIQNEKSILIALDSINQSMWIDDFEIVFMLYFDRKLNEGVYTFLLWSREILQGNYYKMIVDNDIINTDHIKKSIFFQYLIYEVEQYNLSCCNMPQGMFLACLHYMLEKIFIVVYNNCCKVSKNTLNFDNNFIKLKSRLRNDNILRINKSLSSMEKLLEGLPLFLTYYDKKSCNWYLLEDSSL